VVVRLGSSYRYVLTLLAACAQSGCGPAQAPAVKPVASRPANPVGDGTAAAAARPPAGEPSAEDIEAATPSAKPKLLLGSPDLTVGIPGEGELTVAEIQAWLDDPANHEKLDFILPLGLAAGRKLVKGIEANPLTRAKIELGRQLFFDPRLSVDGTVSCASCHSPDHGYAAETRFGVGIGGKQGGRNSPAAFNRILSEKQFWDGRADSLEEQALGPIANPIEMGHTHEACLECLKGIEGYRLQFDMIFGDFDIEHVGQAIASFERVLVTGPAPFDYHEQFRPFAEQEEDDFEGDDLIAYQQAKKAMEAHPMSEAAVRGRDSFFSEKKGGCTACHVGPNLTDELYHNLGVGMDAAEPDLGRFVVTHEEKDRGAFKTPTIRNVTRVAPYMHDGSQKTLEEVVDWYAKGGHPNPQLDPKIKKLNLTAGDKKDLVEFMKACESELPKVERGRIPK